MEAVLISFLIFQFSIPVLADDSGGSSAFRFGLMAHDVESSSGVDSTDINLELVFQNEIDGIPWSPRPVIGASLNSEGDTSQIYGGVAWEYDFSDRFFGEVFLGAAYHDGENELTGQTPGRGETRGYGCELNFRENLSFGWRLDGQSSVMATVSHMSNGRLCDPNDGLTNFGLRVSRGF